MMSVNCGRERRPGVRYDKSVREAAFSLFDTGLGYKAVSSILGLPRSTVRDWARLYREFGYDAMTYKCTRPCYGPAFRLIVAKDIIDNNLSLTEGMAKYKIRSKSALRSWCEIYRRDGAFSLLATRWSKLPTSIKKGEKSDEEDAFDLT